MEIMMPDGGRKENDETRAAFKQHGHFSCDQN